MPHVNPNRTTTTTHTAGPFSHGLAHGVPRSWRHSLAGVAGKIDKMSDFVADDRKTHTVFPPAELTFAALTHTPLSKVRVVIIGQDPYPGPGQANGLAFSVSKGQPLPASLKNIYAELNSDLGIPPSTSGDLSDWAKQGVLLLNTSLTVREHEPASHSGKGWEEITNAILEAVNKKKEPVVFLLLGKNAQELGKGIDTSKHVIVERAHPSPLSFKHGFAGTKPFSAVNDALVAAGRPPIDWHVAP